MKRFSSTQQGQLCRTQHIPAPRDEVFAFFADAHNLERITPDFLNFRILTPAPIRMHEGTIIDYRLRLFGLPVNWKTRIDRFEPDVRFIDIQLAGPYRRWHHLHEFEAIAGGTRMRDVVNYEIPFGPLGRLAERLLVGQTLDKIFSFRYQAIEEIFCR